MKKEDAYKENLKRYQKVSKMDDLTVQMRQMMIVNKNKPVINNMLS